MASCFQPVYRSSAKYSIGCLDALAAYYRYHKEVRNSLIHRGGVANATTVAAYSQAISLTGGDIGSKDAVRLEPVSSGQRVELSLFSVIQLADVVNRMVLTLDAELVASPVAEDRFVAEWKSSSHTNRTLPSAVDRRLKKIEAMCEKLDLVRPVNAGLIDDLLRARGLGV
ncbi:hypothetical protein ACFQZ4_08845 [Catellatospora coxensis]